MNKEVEKMANDGEKFCRSLSDEWKDVNDKLEKAKGNPFSKEFKELSKRLISLIEIKDRFYDLAGGLTK